MYPIASYTATGNVSTISFTGIPQNFTHLQLRMFMRGSGTSGPNTLVVYNSDGGANYRVHYIGANSSAPFSGDFGSGITAANAGWMAGSDQTAGGFGIAIMDIYEYSKTNKNKASKSITGAEANTNSLLGFFTSIWFNTAAINSLALTPSAGQFVQGTRIDLYGVTTSNATGA
jgi:hypothetical protein